MLNSEIALECLRLATEFGSETVRQDPIKTADKYYQWVLQVSERKSCTCKTSKKKSLIADLKGKDKNL